MQGTLWQEGGERGGDGQVTGLGVCGEGWWGERRDGETRNGDGYEGDGQGRVRRKLGKSVLFFWWVPWLHVVADLS